ncbi:hypothetical protein T265_09541 [Opisthorchis viverrini]|uniref:Uncharacterized protein n=1 Tax=Opisthorchis viverrini TaxID=6198 RepID=A0A074Z9U1_OPIVI|nr:hypothetical protein T265_09541 [Opisthorchis viverrini]KER22342.1 hypothetical protein T265_09541 [Opisthorchis viverrini]
MRYTSLTEFVRLSGGTRVIEKILIANNGIAAVKCMRSLRKWAYATFLDSEALVFVCMATPEDVQANAEYIKMANKTVMVPGGSNPNNYANVELILQTAVTNEVDAVWAGWGHASENPQLPEVLSKHNIAFLGPSHYAMWALGDKVASTILAQSADVPTLPWSGSNLRVPLTPRQSPQSSALLTELSLPNEKSPLPLKTRVTYTDGRIGQTTEPCFYLGQPPHTHTLPTHSHTNVTPLLVTPTSLLSEDLYSRACVSDVAGCQACAELIGYPVMIKAAEGGGGKGIRKASTAAEVVRFFPQVQSEVPGSPIFVMKCAQRSRHLEVQLLADQYGQAISLFGRDCSVQRRHQKIIEEAPIVVAPKEAIEAMERAAVRLAKLVGYVSAGTVEYLYDSDSNQFFFLELNPRLQVEHPCTEVVAEVNLPACQLQIAMGIPLRQIKDIRELYRLPVNSDEPVCFEHIEHLRRPPSCHVIAARITSEDPDEGFKPRPGDVQELNFKSSQSVWGYFSVGSAGGIHEFADSQFGHCFSAAESREQARENLVLALKELSIRGDFRTTVEYLIKVMESEEFMNHEIDTDWLDFRIAKKDQVEKPDVLLGVVCTALHIADRHFRQMMRNYELHLERGQFLPSNTLTNSVDVSLLSDSTKYEVKVIRTGPSTLHLISNGSLLSVEVHRMSSDGLLVCHELASYMTYCHEDAEGYRTVINNRSVTFFKESDPSVLRSHSTGKLLQFTVLDGAHVSANEIYALVEVMKLVLELRVPAAGRITLKRLPGSTLEPGTELASLQLDDPTQMKCVQLYTGPLILPCGSGSSNSLARRMTIQGDLGINFNSFNCVDSTVAAKAKRGSTDSALPSNRSSESRSSSQSPAMLSGLPSGKLHIRFSNIFASLEQVLLGYALPEPFLTSWLNQSLDQLMSLLHDPRLPLLELQDTVAHLAGRLPPQMERELRAQVKLYAGQVTSVMANFPSNQIRHIVESQMNRLRRALGPKTSDTHGKATQHPELLKFEQTVQRLTDLADRYQNGLRGHAIYILAQLLLGYVVVEKHFQYGQYDKCIRLLLSQCASSTVWANESAIASGSGDGLDCEEPDESHTPYRVSPNSVAPALRALIQPRTFSDVMAVLFSHRQLSAKNVLLVRLIDLLRDKRELSTAYDLKGSLKALTELGAVGNAKVALSARQLLISLQTPSYELRRNQAESIFLSAVDVYGHQFHPENLRRLIESETVVFDILSDFFYHPNPAVAGAALEVYVRRAYTTYELTSVQHVQLPNGASFVPFRFTLPTAQCLANTRDSQTTECLSSSIKAVSTDGVLFPADLYAAGDLASNFSVPAVSLADQIHPSCYVWGNVSSDSSLRLPQAAVSRSLADVDTASMMGERMGGMAAFNSLSDLEESFADIINLFMDACSEAKTMQGSFSEPSLFNFGRVHFPNSDNGPSQESTYRCPPMVVFQDPPYQTTNPEEEPIHILNIAIRHSAVWSDNCSPSESPLFHSGEFFRNTDTGAAHISSGPTEADDVAQLESFCSKHHEQLRFAGIRRITFLIVKTREFPKCYTFRARDNYREDRVYRHLEPALAFQLELNRMRKYELEGLPSWNRRMHLYLAKSKVGAGKSAVDYRFFVRCIVRHADMLSREASFEFLQSEAERTLLEAMDALELAYTHPDAVHTMGNHIFLNIAPILFLEDINLLKTTIRRTVLRYARRFIRLRVTQAELKLRIRLQPSEPPIPLRVMLNDRQGYNLALDIYREVYDPSTGEVLLWSLGPPRGPLHGEPALLPHKNKDYLQLKRFQARKFNTTYVYDYPKLIEQALLDLWRTYRPDQDKQEMLVGDPHSPGAALQSENVSKPPINGSSTHQSSSQTNYPNTYLGGETEDPVVISCTELALEKDGQLHPVVRNPGSNAIGIVVWHMVLRTPDTPSGRAIIVIANDATHMAGSFGPAEDLTLHRASRLARQLGIPRIYLASNTGARIRVAEEVKEVFRVAWLDPAHPEKGYAYLYLTPEDFDRLRAYEAVNCEKITAGDEVRYKIVDIVGKDYDMSVENLRGSAMIAGETSVAYDDIFTLTIVTNRAIGIGAYLARLGQRVIQVKNSHIILTGAMALNKLLGRDVYTSNSQLGGVQVMANNGVSHLVASDELMALEYALDWLACTPVQRGQLVPVLYRPVPFQQLYPSGPVSSESVPWYISCSNRDVIPFDPIDRTVDYIPSKDRQNDDPRWMFTGVMASQLKLADESLSVKKSTGSIDSVESTTNSDRWLSGFFDWGTWRETLASWAAGVVVGRARLGGIPCGTVTAETRSVVCRVPADPANLSSEAQVVNQAGQVWYPDSAYKTAQAIEDLARERLPLFVFASWRGFSGGMKDMYDQVLKFGSMIIDALRRYPEPVFVYLPPHSQLRGGAWVVVDPAINPDRMEMYADPQSCRAGVLEPEGTVEIKYRRADMIKTMHRLDGRCRRLLEEIDRLQSGGPGGVESSLPVKDHIFQLKAELEARQKELRPYYHQVACTFADLHDTPGRLLSRGLINGLVEWPKSRTFFFGRLRRRLLELNAVRRISAVSQLNKNAHQESEPVVRYFQKSTLTSHHLTQAISRAATKDFNRPADGGGDESVDPHIPRIRFAMAPLRVLLPECPPSSPIQSDNSVQAQPDADDGPAVSVVSNNNLAQEVAKSVPRIAVNHSADFAYGLSCLRQCFIEDYLASSSKSNEKLNGLGQDSAGHIPRPRVAREPNQMHTDGSEIGLKSKRKSHKSMGAKHVSKSELRAGHVSIEASPSFKLDHCTSSPNKPLKPNQVWEKDDMAVGNWLSVQLGAIAFQRVPTVGILDIPSVIEQENNTSELPSCSLVRRKIEELETNAILERLRSFLCNTDRTTEQLGALLTESLDATQRARLVHLLSSDGGIDRNDEEHEHT